MASFPAARLYRWARPWRRWRKSGAFEVLANPFSLSDGFVGPDQPADNAIYEDALIGQWVAPFIMAAINTKNIHRSNALLGHAYGPDFQYDEMMITGSGEQGKKMAEFVGINLLVGDDVPQLGEGQCAKLVKRQLRYLVYRHGC